jgi:hypothetical protein
LPDVSRLLAVFLPAATPLYPATEAPVATILCDHEVDPSMRHSTRPFRRIVDAAARSGYQAAVSTERGPIMPSTNPLRLKRYLIHNDTTLDEFKTFLLR